MPELLRSDVCNSARAVRVFLGCVTVPEGCQAYKKDLMRDIFIVVT